MKRRIVLFSVCLGLLGMAAGIRAAAAAVPGCVTCHGDEAAMKAQVKPVLPTSAEGEG